MSQDYNKPKDFSWAGLAATTGATGLGGFIYDRYIRGNRDLIQNLKMAAGFGLGGALTSTLYQTLSDQTRLSDNKNRRGDEITDQAGNTQRVDASGNVIEETHPLRQIEDVVGHPATRVTGDVIGGGLFIDAIRRGIKDAVKGIRRAGDLAYTVIDKAGKKVSVPLTSQQLVDTAKSYNEGLRAVANSLAQGNKVPRGAGSLWQTLQDLAKQLKTGTKAVIKPLKPSELQLLRDAGISPNKAVDLINAGQKFVIQNGKAVLNPAMRQNALLRLSKNVRHILGGVWKGAKSGEGLAGAGIVIGNEALGAAARNNLLSNLLLPKKEK